MFYFVPQMTTFLFAMTHSPALDALLQTNPALWFAYVNHARYKSKAKAHEEKKEWAKATYYHERSITACRFIHGMGYSSKNIGQPRVIKPRAIK
jgi:hypothetical protein